MTAIQGFEIGLGLCACILALVARKLALPAIEAPHAYSNDAHVGRQRRSDAAGNSLVETAIMLPILIAIVFNAVNFGYFWFVGLKLAAAARSGAEYSSQGGAALTTGSVPSGSEIALLALENLKNSPDAPTPTAVVRVCSSSIGIDSTSHITACDTFPSSPSITFPANIADPEHAVFALNRVDVAYTFTPIIRGAAFGLLLPSKMTFHRQVSMRSLY